MVVTGIGGAHPGPRGRRRSLVAFLAPATLILTAVVAVALGVVTRGAQRETLESNAVFLSNTVRSMTTLLRGIESSVAAGFERNRDLITYTHRLGRNEYFEVTAVSDFLTGIVVSNEPVVAAHYYRVGDPYVYRHDTFVALDRFPFVDALDPAGAARPFFTQFSWFLSAYHPEFQPRAAAERSVVMLFGYPLLQPQKLAYVTVTISAPALAEWLSLEPEDPVSSLRITDTSNDQTLLSLNAGPGSIELASFTDEARGLRYTSGIRAGRGYGLVQMYSWAFLPLAVALAAAATLWIIALVRRRNRLVDAIIGSIESVTAIGSSSDARDDIALIRDAVTELVRRSTLAEEEGARNREYRIGDLTQTLLDGLPGGGSVEAELDELMPDVRSMRLGVLIVEIDRLHQLEDSPGADDQGLLRFAVKRGVEEAAARGGAEAWSRWTGHDRLAVIVFLSGGADDSAPPTRLVELAEIIRGWVGTRFPFTVTIAVPGPCDRASEIAERYLTAQSALALKPILGMNRVISEPEFDRTKSEYAFTLYGRVDELAVDLRSGGADWPSHLASIIDGARDAALPRDSISRLVDYTAFVIDREMRYVPEPARREWEARWMRAFHDAARDFDLIEGLHARLRTLLSQVSEAVVASAHRDRSAVIVAAVREHIDSNYSDPGLSLDRYCEEHRISRSHLSRAFKEHSGTNFVDYLIDVRIRAAQRLLAETDYKIEDVAHEVGYLHPFSFSRAFRHATKMSPSEFRAASTRS